MATSIFKWTSKPDATASSMQVGNHVSTLSNANRLLHSSSAAFRSKSFASDKNVCDGIHKKLDTECPISFGDEYNFMSGRSDGDNSNSFVVSGHHSIGSSARSSSSSISNNNTHHNPFSKCVDDVGVLKNKYLGSFVYDQELKSGSHMRQNETDTTQHILSPSSSASPLPSPRSCDGTPHPLNLNIRDQTPCIGEARGMAAGDMIELNRKRRSASIPSVGHRFAVTPAQRKNTPPLSKRTPPLSKRTPPLSKRTPPLTYVKTPLKTMTSYQQNMTFPPYTMSVSGTQEMQMQQRTPSPSTSKTLTSATNPADNRNVTNQKAALPLQQQYSKQPEVVKNEEMSGKKYYNILLGKTYTTSELQALNSFLSEDLQHDTLAVPAETQEELEDPVTEQNAPKDVESQSDSISHGVSRNTRLSRSRRASSPVVSHHLRAMSRTVSERVEIEQFVSKVLRKDNPDSFMNLSVEKVNEWNDMAIRGVQPINQSPCLSGTRNHAGSKNVNENDPANVSHSHAHHISILGSQNPTVEQNTSLMMVKHDLSKKRGTVPSVVPSLPLPSVTVSNAASVHHKKVVDRQAVSIQAHLNRAAAAKWKTPTKTPIGKTVLNPQANEKKYSRTSSTKNNITVDQNRSYIVVPPAALIASRQKQLGVNCAKIRKSPKTSPKGRKSWHPLSPRKQRDFSYGLLRRIPNTSGLQPLNGKKVASAIYGRTTAVCNQLLTSATKNDIKNNVHSSCIDSDETLEVDIPFYSATTRYRTECVPVKIVFKASSTEKTAHIISSKSTSYRRLNKLIAQRCQAITAMSSFSEQPQQFAQRLFFTDYTNSKKSNIEGDRVIIDSRAALAAYFSQLVSMYLGMKKNGHLCSSRSQDLEAKYITNQQAFISKALLFCRPITSTTELREVKEEEMEEIQADGGIRSDEAVLERQEEQSQVNIFSSSSFGSLAQSKSTDMAASPSFSAPTKDLSVLSLPCEKRLGTCSMYTSGTANNMPSSTSILPYAMGQNGCMNHLVFRNKNLIWSHNAASAAACQVRSNSVISIEEF